MIDFKLDMGNCHAQLYCGLCDRYFGSTIKGTYPIYKIMQTINAHRVSVFHQTREKS